MRISRFRVERSAGDLRFDGVDTATVEIESHGPTRGFFHVRPLRRRRVYSLDLAATARLVIEAVARLEAAQRKPSRRARRNLLTRGSSR